MPAPIAAAASSSVAPALVTAGASLVGGLMSAKQEKRRRKQEAKLRAAEIEHDTGKQKQKALSDIIGNFRAALVR